jgi:ribA/ribD-fused uncharacterized protein
MVDRDKLKKAADSLNKALNILMSDSLGRIEAEKRTAFTVDGSWSGSHSVIFEELLDIHEFLREQGFYTNSIVECHGLDTPFRICFYEHDYYVFSNFSSFQIKWKNKVFMTSEHVYHYEKFDYVPDNEGLQPGLKSIRQLILGAVSAHEAFEIGQAYKVYRNPSWDDIKVDVMERILIQKVLQNTYVAKKLFQSGNRELVEDSWRDNVWGWGPDKDGQNLLGKTWMKVRDKVKLACNGFPPEVLKDSSSLGYVLDKIKYDLQGYVDE